MAGIKYLARIGKRGVFYIRRPVPKALRKAIPGPVLKRSLRTSNYAEALLRFAEANASVERMFTQAHRGMAPTAPPGGRSCAPIGGAPRNG